MERDPNAQSVCIMLVPDVTLRSQRPNVEEIHLTVAYFGHMLPGDPRVTELRRMLPSIGKNLGRPVKAVANAVGIFPDRGNYAVVDLIDGIETFYVRRLIESLFGRDAPENGPRVDYTHGFTPHVTRKYVTAEEFRAEDLQPGEPIEFTFDTIGVWHGPTHYEVAL